VTVCCIRRGVLGAGAGRRGSDSSPDGLLRVAGARFASADDGYRRRGLWAFDSLNGNVASMVLGYLDRSAADVCFLQELRLANAPILAGRAHGCVGAVVVVRGACRGHAQWQHQCWCCGCRAVAMGWLLPRQAVDVDELRTRVQVRWMVADCRGGLRLLSVYLCCGEGLVQRNIDLLRCPCAGAGAHPRPLAHCWRILHDSRNAPRFWFANAYSWGDARPCCGDL
jgi:hypothetical protein